jgi:isopenicillin N synthase-like dioxygenase
LTEKGRKWFDARGKTLTGENKWPGNDFKPTMKAYIEQLKVIGAATMQTMALSLNVDPDTFTQFMDDPFWYLIQ